MPESIKKLQQKLSRNGFKTSLPDLRKYLQDKGVLLSDDNLDSIFESIRNDEVIQSSQMIVHNQELTTPPESQAMSNIVPTPNYRQPEMSQLAPIPSHKETRSLVLAEASKLGLELNTTDVLDITDAVQDVEVYDKNTIRSQIEKYIYDQADIAVNEEAHFVNSLVEYTEIRERQAERILVDGVSDLMSRLKQRRKNFNEGIGKVFTEATEASKKRHGLE